MIRKEREHLRNKRRREMKRPREKKEGRKRRREKKRPRDRKKERGERGDEIGGLRGDERRRAERRRALPAWEGRHRQARVRRR